MTQMNLSTNRNQLTDTENRPVVAMEERVWGRVGLEVWD